LALQGKKGFEFARQIFVYASNAVCTRLLKNWGIKNDPTPNMILTIYHKLTHSGLAATLLPTL